MDKMERISEINEQLGSFIYEDMFFLVMSLGLFLLLIATIIVAIKTKYKNAPFLVLGIGMFSFMMTYVALEFEQDELEKELFELEAFVIVDSLQEETTIETTNIVKSVQVDNKYCANVKLKDAEHCTYIEFLSGTDITQVFVPLTKTVSASKDNPLQITYLNLPEEEREGLNEFFDIENVRIADDIKLYRNGWSLGVSVLTSP